MPLGPACSSRVRTTSRCSRSLLRERRCCPKTATPIELRWPMQIQGREAKGWPPPEAEKNLRNSFACRSCHRPCRADLKACLIQLRPAVKRYYQVNAQARFGETGKCRSSQYAARHSFPGTTTRRVFASSRIIRNPEPSSPRLPRSRPLLCQNSQHQRHQRPDRYAHPERLPKTVSASNVGGTTIEPRRTLRLP